LPAPGTARRLGFQVVQPGWFETLGIRVLEGRDFGAGDTDQSAPAILVNKTLAEQVWPGQSPIGQRGRRSRSAAAPFATIVGVVSDTHHPGPAKPPRPEFYLPFKQSPFSFMAIALRTNVEPTSLASAIRAAVADVDPAVPAADLTPMDDYLTRAYGSAR